MRCGRSWQRKPRRNDSEDYIFGGSMKNWLLYVLLVALLLCVLFISWRVDSIAGITAQPTPHVAVNVYIHGKAVLEDDLSGVKGFTAQLYCDGRLIATSTSVAANGAWGVEVGVRTGLYHLTFVPPAGYAVTGIVKAPNVTDFAIFGNHSGCQFRVSPAGGQTGDFIVFCVAKNRTPTPSRTPLPTATWTPQPAMPTPTWTPGPTPCFRDPSPELLDAVTARIMAMFPADRTDEMTRLGFLYGFGWPMLTQSVELSGQTYRGQLWTPFTLVVRWPDGCYSIIDAATFMPG